MDRQEVIALLTELREAGEVGSPRWSKLMDDIRERGPIHDQQFVTCADCGGEFEQPHDFGSGRACPPVRCFDCRAA